MTPEKRLVVVYGPPASGKLPIAEAISVLTDWILFDNSAAIDFVAQFLSPGTPRFLELIDSLRLDLIPCDSRKAVAWCSHSSISASMVRISVFSNSWRRLRPRSARRCVSFS
jgi:hypothetical protein